MRDATYYSCFTIIRIRIDTGMMTELEQSLYRSRKTLREACEELNLVYSDTCISSLDTCSSCGIWVKYAELVPDEDKNPICKECLTYYGM